MDSAIARAERDAAEATARARAARSQLAQWAARSNNRSLESEGRVVAMLRAIQAALDSEAFQRVAQDYVDAHCDAFDDDDTDADASARRAAFVELHDGYVEVLEHTIDRQAPGVDLDRLTTELPKLLGDHAHRPADDDVGRTIKRLVSVLDYQSFVDMMRTARLERLAPPRPGTVPRAGRLVAQLGLDRTLAAQTAPLLLVYETSSTLSWSPIANKKGDYMLDCTEVNGSRYLRSAMNVGLDLADAVECMRFTHPKFGEWNDLYAAVHVVREHVSGDRRVADMRIKLKLPSACRRPLAGARAQSTPL